MDLRVSARGSVGYTDHTSGKNEAWPDGLKSNQIEMLILIDHFRVPHIGIMPQGFTVHAERKLVDAFSARLDVRCA